MEHQHTAALSIDARELVNFPPPMRQHMLANMRGHLNALSDILTALAQDKYAQAAELAEASLGMNSPAAAGCRVDDAEAAKVSPVPNMDQHMTQLMPEGMRQMGRAMHQAASDFAIEATKAAESGDGKATLAALSRITAQCTACHAAYRVQ
jgi:cytochrome c556